ncbi:MAG: hypothetical protein A2X36_07885 [Elusimicrobia bacterium GWA2_69_24]|nr:MAG: hypothetical protein A2X52_14710 [Candidatus Rokubacteria bacterium GWC2_70_16]OGR58593.1 MAG: hypothetical protein A2X36_07885 [Elusimicrobia bacterium GWA2_69_24]HBH01470.1 hypothetical protein [Candidatus Rokubacteria bacterium]
MSPIRLVVFLAACLLAAEPALAQPKIKKAPPAGPLITIHAPHSEQFEVALDEVELDWSGDPTAKSAAPGHYATAIAGAAVVDTDVQRATFRVSGIFDQADLSARAKALQAANPGADYYLVLYEPGRPRTKATRRLLTREVAMLLDPGTSPQGVLAGLPGGGLRAVPGVADGYVVEAAEPLAAVELADELRQRGGVRNAYPLLKRQQFPR